MRIRVYSEARGTAHRRATGHAHSARRLHAILEHVRPVFGWAAAKSVT